MKKIQDERITRGTNALLAKYLWLMLAVQGIVLTVKLLLGATLHLCLLDVAVLAIGGVGVAAFRTLRGLWGQKDEVLREIDESGRARMFTGLMWLLVIGSFLQVFLDKQHILWYAPSMLVWFVPSVLFVTGAMRGGLLLWGGRKQQEQGPRRLLLSTAVASVFFGLLLRGSACIVDGVFRPEGLVEVVVTGASWGVMFYAMMRFLMHHGQKQADAQVAQAEAAASDEE